MGSEHCLKCQVPSSNRWSGFFFEMFLQTEAVPDRLPCKQADDPDGELGVVNLTTIVEPCEFLEINLFSLINL